MGQDRREVVERLFRQYGKGVGSYVLARVGDPELAEEISARVFLTVVRCIHQQRGSAVGWLWAIVRSELARHYRDRHRHVSSDADWPAPGEPPPERLAREESQARLQAALARLTEDQQQIVYLKFFLDMRNTDIAEAIGLTPSHVGVLIHRMLKQLRMLMGEEHPKLEPNEVDHDHSAR